MEKKCNALQDGSRGRNAWERGGGMLGNGEGGGGTERASSSPACGRPQAPHAGWSAPAPPQACPRSTPRSLCLPAKFMCERDRKSVCNAVYINICNISCFIYYNTIYPPGTMPSISLPHPSHSNSSRHRAQPAFLGTREDSSREKRQDNWGGV